MMRYCWLADTRLGYNLIHAKPGATANTHDLLTRFVGKRFGKLNCVHNFII